jgi:hypothetical protein
VVAATIGGDDEVRGKVGRERLHQDMRPLVRTAPAAGVADDPADCVACRDRHEVFARLQYDVGHHARRGEGLINRTLAIGIDLDGVEEPRGLRNLRRGAIGTGYPRNFRSDDRLAMTRPMRAHFGNLRRSSGRCYRRRRRRLRIGSADAQRNCRRGEEALHGWISLWGWVLLARLGSSGDPSGTLAGGAAGGVAAGGAGSSSRLQSIAST